MLKLLIGLILLVFFFVVLFFNRIRESLSAGGMAVLLVIMLALSGFATWLGFVDSGRQKTATVEFADQKAVRPSSVDAAPVRTTTLPGDGVPGACRKSMRRSAPPWWWFIT